MIFLCVLAMIFLADYCIKAYVERTKAPNISESKCNGKIVIRHTRNYGTAGGRLKDKPKLVCTLHGLSMLLVSAAYIKLLLSDGNSLLKLAGACLLGGGASNLFDRLKKGYVTDYVSFNVPVTSIRRLVFNISDFFIFAGGIIGVIVSIKDGM